MYTLNYWSIRIFKEVKGPWYNYYLWNEKFFSEIWNLNLAYLKKSLSNLSH